MNKKISKLSFAFAAMLLLSACSITAPLTATSNPVGKKIGTAKANVILGLSFGGDFGIQSWWNQQNINS